jgi:flagellar assembly factor FliW
MLVQTINFGSLEIPESKVVTFKEGLPGFSQIRRFAVIEMEELKPFQYLQSLDEPFISLFIINPFLIDPSYEFRLTDADMEDVNSTNSAELAVYVVATIPADPNGATLNLMAPIVINDRDRRGKQVILHESKYLVKHPLLCNAGHDEAKARKA